MSFLNVTSGSNAKAMPTTAVSKARPIMQGPANSGQVLTYGAVCLPPRHATAAHEDDGVHEPISPDVLQFAGDQSPVSPSSLSASSQLHHNALGETVAANACAMSSTTSVAHPSQPPAAHWPASAKGTSSLWRRLSADTWYPEVIALALSVASLVAIVAVLGAYDNQPLPTFAYDVTLNGIVQALATVSKSALMLAVASTISQAKWIWFHKRPRKLEDIDVLDEASRGPLGSMQLIFGPTIRSLASVGAVITVLAIAFEFFLQQLIGYPLRTVPSGTQLASGKQAFAFPPVNTARYDTSSMFENAIQLGIWEGELPHTSPACPTGNCDWPSFRSLG